jgi:hypothetical protein
VARSRRYESLADRPVTVPREHPREPQPDKLLVDEDIPHPNEGHRSAVAVPSYGVNVNQFPEDQGRGRLLGLGAEVLSLLRAVDAPQPDLLLPSIMDRSDAIAIDDTDDFPDQAAAVAGNSKRESAKSHGNPPELVPMSAIL